jgi:hypothetical protein
MEAMRRLYAWLKLRINQAKSAVARAAERKFLGFSLWIAPGRKVKLRVASETWKRVKERVRMLTRRVVGKKHGGRVQGIGVLERYPHIGDDLFVAVLASNLWRCTGYQNNFRPVRAAAAGRPNGHESNRGGAAALTDPRTQC